MVKLKSESMPRELLEMHDSPTTQAMDEVAIQSFAEYWYNTNTNFHTSLTSTPFQALYGYPPPHFNLHSHRTTTTEAQGFIQERQAFVQKLRENLQSAQSHMKFYADQKRLNANLLLATSSTLSFRHTASLQ